MPTKGYKKPGARTEIMKFRATPAERDQYEAAAEHAGYANVSEWLRAIATAAAGAAQPANDD